MNEIIVPIDITAEEKSVLAVFSIRQFFFVAPAAVFTFVFLMWGFIPLINGLAGFIIRAVICLFVDLFMVACAFLKIEKYEQFFNEFLITQIKFKKSQKTYI
ncbi:PrgI family protein [Paenibacillus alginolyticus]|uniref:PrgI family mobile element protein n=1 Tax=Paenibacillus alginolyticus TaxID=59839 RepID=UPI00041EA476|nr:PrgI family protein [Paenibacillus alginolyticus]MCY9665745.1 PrgI family protein [Paenibacillus alginolyticus]